MYVDVFKVCVFVHMCVEGKGHSSVAKILINKYFKLFSSCKTKNKKKKMSDLID